MNIACIPYHDWRKIEMEGARTRDSHLISHLRKSSLIKNIVVINRPITWPELKLKKKGKEIEGELIFNYKGGRLYKLSSNCFVFDYFSKDFLGPLIKGKSWFFNSFGDSGFVTSLNACLEFLNIKIDVVYNQNVFANQLVDKLGLPSVFDAWDNFILFPENKKYERDFREAYEGLASNSRIWTTNSKKNIDYYNSHYHPQECVLIKNGVDVEKFSRRYDIPQDLVQIRRPIIGFGGKITHLFNFDYFNDATRIHKNKSFVIVGQILDKEVFSKIERRPNVFYLGDKHYNEYSSYVTNFDVGIIPYVTDKLEHGADSIKMYEYLAAGLNVVGTSGAGMADMQQYIKVATSSEAFSNYIEEAVHANIKIELPEYHTWNYKANETIQCLTKIKINTI